MSDEPKPIGPYGDGGLKPGRYNARLFKRAIRRGWKAPDEKIQAGLEQMANVAASSRSERNQIAAMSVLLEAEKVLLSKDEFAYKMLADEEKKKNGSDLEVQRITIIEVAKPEPKTPAPMVIEIQPSTNGTNGSGIHHD